MPMPMPSQALYTCRPLLAAAARRHRSAQRGVAVRASKGDGDGDGDGGRMVDEDMATLRRRIREVRAAEDGLDVGDLPAGWAEWERQHYASYVGGVCDVVGLLKEFLTSTRPSLGVGLVALLLFSVPTSVFFVSMRLVEVANVVLSAMEGR